MSVPAEKRSYEELEALCARLEAESGRNLVMQQDLIHAKGQVDSELMRFKAIQAYIAKALDTDDPEAFFSLTLESVIEAFEYEVALFLQATESEKLLTVSGEFGFEEPPVDLPFSPKWLNSVNIRNVGYGVSQSLPVIVEILSRSFGSRFAIQQPEVHLHPKAQAALGDLFYQLALVEEKRFIVETHSDFTIDRFMLNYRKKRNPIFPR
ncbi:MAG: AAA family ATPase [Alphaproteobacteria bacterium]|jgi:hypothetical protein|nr:AAA family ATPase [Alphaproteobacteria bacterium]